MLDALMTLMMISCMAVLSVLLIFGLMMVVVSFFARRHGHDKY